MIDSPVVAKLKTRIDKTLEGHFRDFHHPTTELSNQLAIMEALVELLERTDLTASDTYTKALHAANDGRMDADEVRRWENSGD